MKKASEVFNKIRFAKLDPTHDKGPKGSTDDEEHGVVSSQEFQQQVDHVKKRAMQEQHADAGKFKPVRPKVIQNTPNVSPRATNDSANVKLKEDLRKWFDKDHPEGGWKRINSKGEAVGPCAREPGEPKPKCMSNEKRAALSKKERASAVASKRKHDPNPERKGEPINVSNFGKGKISEDMENLEEKNVPTSPEKWAQAKAQAKAKFDVYPSAYANGWASKKYKEMGGGWKSVDEAVKDKFDIGEYDQEGDMAKSDLRSIMANAKRIHDMLEDSTNLPEWVQSKITLAEDYISTVANYMTSEMSEEVVMEEDKFAGWIAHYNGKKHEIKKHEAKDLYDAKQKAIAHFKAPKSKHGLIGIAAAYNEEVEIEESRGHKIIDTFFKNRQAAQKAYQGNPAHDSKVAAGGGTPADQGIAAAKKEVKEGAVPSTEKTVTVKHETSGKELVVTAKSANEYKQRGYHPVKEDVEQLEEGRPSQRHPLEGHEYHKKTNAELEYIAKDAHKAAEAMKSHNTTAENKYRDQANDSATVRHFRKTSGTPDWYKKKYGMNEDVSAEGEKAAKAGTKWHENPHPSGSKNAYEWDKGHTKVRTKDMKEGYYKDMDTNRKEDERLGSWKKETPWTKTKGTVTDKSGAKHTPMSRARDLARSAMKKNIKEFVVNESRLADIVREAAENAKKKKKEAEKQDKVVSDDKFQKDPELSTQIIRND
jgi:hypothetical protein